MSSSLPSARSLLKEIRWVLGTLAVYAALGIGCFLMLRTIAGYASFRGDVQFLLQKQAYLANPVWKTAFYIHVFSAILALCAGFTQFSSHFLRDRRDLHRLIGKVYVWDILAVNVPAGLVMGIYANGGPAGKAAFLLLDGLWFLFTWQALRKAQARDFAAHRRFMMRSYALTFSAITLRTWKLILTPVLPVDPAQLYIIDAWLGFVPNLLVAEWLISGRNRYYWRSPMKRE